jgi:hypothetical protein
VLASERAVGIPNAGTATTIELQAGAAEHFAAEAAEATVPEPGVEAWLSRRVRAGQMAHAGCGCCCFCRWDVGRSWPCCCTPLNALLAEAPVPEDPHGATPAAAASPGTPMTQVPTATTPALAASTSFSPTISDAAESLRVVREQIESLAPLWFASPTVDFSAVISRACCAARLEITCGGCCGRGCVGVVGLVATRGEAAAPALVHAGAGCGLGSLFLDGLLGPERRKTGWMRAEAAGDPGPWRQQAILGRGRWEADALRDLVRGYVLETMHTVVFSRDLGPAAPARFGDHVWWVLRSRMRWSCGPGRYAR